MTEQDTVSITKQKEAGLAIFMSAQSRLLSEEYKGMKNVI